MGTDDAEAAFLNGRDDGRQSALDLMTPILDAKDGRIADLEEMLREWCVWYAAQRHIGPTTAWAIVRGEAEWPNAPPSEQSIPARTIALLNGSK